MNPAHGQHLSFNGRHNPGLKSNPTLAYFALGYSPADIRNLCLIFEAGDGMIPRHGRGMGWADPYAIDSQWDGLWCGMIPLVGWNDP